MTARLWSEEPKKVGRPATGRGTYRTRSGGTGTTPHRHHLVNPEDFQQEFNRENLCSGGYFVTFIHGISDLGEHDLTRVYVKSDSKVAAILKAERYVTREYESYSAAPAKDFSPLITEGVQHAPKERAGW